MTLQELIKENTGSTDVLIKSNDLKVGQTVRFHSRIVDKNEWYYKEGTSTWYTEGFIHSITETRINFSMRSKMSIGTTGRSSNKAFFHKKNIERYIIEKIKDAKEKRN